MKTFIKCEVCEAEIPGEMCIFATCRRKIGGREYYFCCEKHAREFEQKLASKKRG